MSAATSARALRKQLLLMRSDVQRFEVAEASQALRASLTFAQVLRAFTPGVLARGALPVLLRLAGRLPWLGPRTRRLAENARARPAVALALRAAGLALVAWQVWRTVDSVRRALQRR